MKIEHDSRNLFFRSPFGAVKEGSRVRLKLLISGCGIPESVGLIYYKKNVDIKNTDMSYITDIGEYCVYQAEIELSERAVFWYFFRVKISGKCIYYGNNEDGLGGKGKIYNEETPKAFQITVYKKDFKTPEWWKKTVCYQIFCDRFYNGNEDGSFLGVREDIIKRNWEDEPYYKAEQFGGEYLSNDFFGGNLSGIVKKLGYLSELGVNAIYLNPVFKAFSNHKYDTGDYLKIDEMFGSEEDFKYLCSEAENNSIKIILDGVFNHTGSDSLYFNKNGRYDAVGAYQSIESEFYDWYNFYDWPDNYESWWGIDILPRLKKGSESILEFFLTGEDSVVKHWLKSGACGWRLDVADELSDDFIKILRTEAKKENPDAVIIGEVWEDASNKESYGEERKYFLGEELDSVMNYPLRDALLAAATGRISGFELDRRIMSLKENYPRPVFYSLLNILSSHDVERILTASSGAQDRRNVSRDYQAEFILSGAELELAQKRTRLLVMLQMLLPGVPCVYYGDEAGMQGYGDPFNRRTYPWGKENSDMLKWYKENIRLRKKNLAYIEGEFETIYKDTRCWGFIRYLNNEKHLVFVNFGDEAIQIRADAARFRINKLKSETGIGEYFSEDGIFYIEMPPVSAEAFSAFYLTM